MTSPQQQPSHPSKTTIGHSAEFLKRRKSLMVLPLLVIPFLFFFFASLGGGKGNKKDKTPSGVGMGFNPELPKPQLDQKKAQQTKLDFYRKADADSQRIKEYLQQDPYHTRSAGGNPGTQSPGNALLPEDPRADQLLQRLDQLKRSIQSPPVPSPGMPRGYPEPPAIARYKPPLALPLPDTPETDPQLERLNTMLDKIIRIQHPGQDAPENTPAHHNETPNPADLAAEAVNSIPAVVQQDRTLVAGATIALRLTESATINGVHIPANQLVYGVASLNNDRLLITVNSIRREQAIYATSLQVYDMDGLPGIHIPGTLSRDVAKQSANQGIGSINLSTYDPSPGAQATNAGIQAAKTLFSRKVRMVRVSVRAGYQVLLRYTGHGGRIQLAHTATPDPDSVGTGTAPDSTRSFRPFMHHGARSEKMQLDLLGIYLQNDILFFYLTLRNQSPIDYIPAYSRWFIRDRHQWRRTAIQEIQLHPIYASFPKIVWGNYTGPLLIGFQPFALPKEKELVLQIAEKNGARELVLVVNHSEILKARKQ